MSENTKNRVCPVEIAGGLDNSIRKFLQNPEKILRPYISKGMSILDFGCGPGFFSVSMARMLEGTGKVIAADLQDGMLEKVKQKIIGTELEKRIELHKCESDKIGITESVDFILVFYVAHEVPDHDKLFQEFKSILKPDGKIYIIEPNFHVTQKAFEEMLIKAKSIGFEIVDKPRMFLNRTVLLAKKK